MRIYVLFVCLLALVPAAASGASGAVYRWTDAKGVIHFTDSPENIPAEQRGALEKSSAEPETSTDAAATKPATPVSTAQEPAEETKSKEGPAKVEAAPSGEAAPAPDVTLDNFGRDETWWRDRKKFWDQRLADDQQAYNDARNEFGRLISRTDNRHYKEMKELRDRMSVLEKDIAKAQEMLGGGLAREARKAGALPGWVR